MHHSNTTASIDNYKRNIESISVVVNRNSDIFSISTQPSLVVIADGDYILLFLYTAMREPNIILIASLTKQIKRFQYFS